MTTCLPPLAGGLPAHQIPNLWLHKPAPGRPPGWLLISCSICGYSVESAGVRFTADVPCRNCLVASLSEQNGAEPPVTDEPGIERAPIIKRIRRVYPAPEDLHLTQVPGTAPYRRH